MTRRIALINGPNLNMLGLREPEVYGTTTLSELEAQFYEQALSLGFQAECLQSNAEGTLVDYIQQARGKMEAIVINSAAYTHTSIAILDALNMFEGTVVEVHISDIHAREPFRHHSYVSLRADHVIIGKGIAGYGLALEHLSKVLG